MWRSQCIVKAIHCQRSARASIFSLGAFSSARFPFHPPPVANGAPLSQCVRVCDIALAAAARPGTKMPAREVHMGAVVTRSTPIAKSRERESESEWARVHLVFRFDRHIGSGD